jgi:quercetin dioxygenase-like cupin family protein
MLLRHNVSLLRQSKVLTEYDPKRGVSVATLAYEYPSRYQVAEHSHGSDQLIYAISGLMEVSSDQSTWLIPPHFALWIPARTHHWIHMPGPVSMRTLYLRANLTARPEPVCAVLHVTPLLRELIVETVRVGQLRTRTSFESWRRQARLTKAVELLVSGYSIKEVAGKVGYCQPSAFVEMFRRTFGTTPKVWISALETLGQHVQP